MTDSRMQPRRKRIRRRKSRWSHPATSGPLSEFRPWRVPTTWSLRGDAVRSVFSLYMSLDVPWKCIFLCWAPLNFLVGFTAAPRIDAAGATEKGAKLIVPIRPVMCLKYQLEVNSETVCLVWDTISQVCLMVGSTAYYWKVTFSREHSKENVFLNRCMTWLLRQVDLKHAECDFVWGRAEASRSPAEVVSQVNPPTSSRNQLYLALDFCWPISTIFQSFSDIKWSSPLLIRIKPVDAKNGDLQLVHAVFFRKHWDMCRIGLTIACLP